MSTFNGGANVGASVIKAGYMTKIGQSHKTWRKRWFVLTETLIVYYKKPNGKLQGTVPVGLIAGVRRARTAAESAKKYVVLVTTVDRVYQFQASNSGERDEWIGAITKMLPQKLALKSTPSIGSTTSTQRVPTIPPTTTTPVTVAPPFVEAFQSKTTNNDSDSKTSANNETNNGTNNETDATNNANTNATILYDTSSTDANPANNTYETVSENITPTYSQVDKSDQKATRPPAQLPSVVEGEISNNSDGMDSLIKQLTEMEYEDDDDDENSDDEYDESNPKLVDPRSVPHYNALVTPYLDSSINRQELDKEKLSWAQILPDYKPPIYEHPTVEAKPVWADVPENIKKFPFNAYDDVCKVDRTSFEGKYLVDEATGMPLNPRGRTGLWGRGLLGRYGPNHAADPIVTRWKTCPDSGLVCKDKNGVNILEFVGVKRKDTGDWALPGGMVDPGESVTVTLKREFGEESLNSLELPENQKKVLATQLGKMFKNGVPLYLGYSDDLRNTDNAWLETTVVNIHDSTGEMFQLFNLSAGDDAVNVSWVQYTPDINLFANHRYFLALALQRLTQPKQFCPPMVTQGGRFRLESLAGK